MVKSAKTGVGIFAHIVAGNFLAGEAPGRHPGIQSQKHVRGDESIRIFQGGQQRGKRFFRSQINEHVECGSVVDHAGPIYEKVHGPTGFLQKANHPSDLVVSNRRGGIRRRLADLRVPCGWRRGVDDQSPSGRRQCVPAPADVPAEPVLVPIAPRPYCENADAKQQRQYRCGRQQAVEHPSVSYRPQCVLCTELCIHHRPRGDRIVVSCMKTINIVDRLLPMRLYVRRFIFIWPVD